MSIILASGAAFATENPPATFAGKRFSRIRVGGTSTLQRDPDLRLAAEGVWIPPDSVFLGERSERASKMLKIAFRGDRLSDVKAFW
jgi:hypothetical protein